LLQRFPTVARILNTEHAAQRCLAQAQLLISITSFVNQVIAKVRLAAADLNRGRISNPSPTLHHVVDVLTG